MERYITHTPKSTLMGDLVFLLLSLPMSIVYFTVTIVGPSAGAGTLVLWIGLPTLFATLYVVRGMAAVERTMVSSLLHMPHPDQPKGYTPTQGFLRRFGALLHDPYTWTSVLYMLFIKLPLGIISFTLTVTFLSVSAVLTCLPLVYLLNLFIDSILLKSGATPDSISIPYFLEIHGGAFDSLMFARSFIGVPLGLVLCFLTRWMLRGLVSFSGVLANAMLGPGTAIYNTQPHALNYAPPARMMEMEQRVHTD